MFFFPRRIPIPTEFYSTETHSPLDSCLVCDCPLLDTDVEYLVEKAIRQHPEYDVQEVIIEYALCLRCHSDLQTKISSASKHALETYFLENTNLHHRASMLLSQNLPGNPAYGGPGSVDPSSDETAIPEGWTDRCIVDGTSINDLHEYQLIGHCIGREMLLTHMPLAIGGPAMDEIMHQLSNETLDELGGFRDEYFGPPESARDIPGPILA
ncbi:hypothetical protein CRI94_05065 [Longibacter salinarum]|uniref:Uncharacterized protein n=1 Tax=Longibacter salinarum TaxID=1850348 RepID=A0A2A8D0J5_9BACT|nr:hypothetical protein [Longibacter salinarum]PEN14404.1 hypothetical protein CRI94_05065 [Longibacter salinarum]